VPLPHRAMAIQLFEIALKKTKWKLASTWRFRGSCRWVCGPTTTYRPQGNSEWASMRRMFKLRHFLCRHAFTLMGVFSRASRQLEAATSFKQHRIANRQPMIPNTLALGKLHAKGANRPTSVGISSAQLDHQDLSPVRVVVTNVARSEGRNADQ